MLAGCRSTTLAVLWLGALLGGIAAGGAGFAFGLAASVDLAARASIRCTATFLIVGCGALLHPDARSGRSGVHIEIGAAVAVRCSAA